ncbi:thiamine pyrophosphate-binding protein [Pseudarthrobacter sp. NPDC058119]|uniref:thiamine pyrophosphate-binding protein n=1 Tax=Pseudarthrobacter sp. NPDC058119 TaxID=3346348 RepID=UPI0036DA7D12
MQVHSKSVSDAIADVVVQRSDLTFGVMGNGNAHFVSSLTSRGAKYVSARHESGTVMMSQTYNLASGKLATATTTYGPGFTNAMTSLAEARLARVPMVVVVGDAPTSGKRGQDVDQVLAARALGIMTFVVGPENAQVLTEKAFNLAEKDRVPVIVAIPYDQVAKDLEEQVDLFSDTDYSGVPPRERAGQAEPDDVLVGRVAAALEQAERPLIIAGRGVHLSGSGAVLREVGDRVGALFATSLMARNVFDSPWDLGIAGGFSAPKAAALMAAADVVIVVGASLNLYQMRYNTLLTGAKAIFQLDLLPTATHSQVTEFIQGDAWIFAGKLLERVTEKDPGWRSAVADDIVDLLAEPEPVNEMGPDGRLDPRAVVKHLAEILPVERTAVQDTGHFMGWVPRYWPSPDPEGMLLPGLAVQSIGLGISCAVGAAHAHPQRLTVLVCGDGGASMGLAELETLIRNVRRGIMIVLNDAAYGMEVHQYAVKGLDEAGMVFDEVNYAAIARSMGAKAINVRSLADLTDVEQWLSSDSQGLLVLDIAISKEVVADWLKMSNAYYSTPSTV